MQTLAPFQRLALAVLVSCALPMAGCGGGGSSESAPSQALSAPSAPALEGTFSGTITGNANTAFQLLVLETGETWALYGSNFGSGFAVTGFIQGSGSSSSGRYTSSDAKDFGYSPAQPTTINATYSTSAQTVSGTVGSVGFSGATTAGALYNYNSPANLSAISGAWTLQELSGAAVAMSINSTGQFSANAQGCQFSGTVLPRASGKNVFNLNFTFGAAPCSLPGRAASGVAILSPLPDGKSNLIVVGVDSSRTYGTAAFGVR